MDKRWAQLGDLLVNYSMEVKPGEKVMIAFIELESYPLMHAIYLSCIQAGAFLQVQFLLWGAVDERQPIQLFREKLNL